MKFSSSKHERLFNEVKDLYNLSENKEKLLFHGWHHIKFVHDKALEFGESIGADLEVVACAALVHDLNYVFTDQLDPEEAKKEIKEILSRVGFENEIDVIINTIVSAHTATRLGNDLSKEAMALSDGDTLFKALPSTPLLFSSKFLSETGYSIEKLADKIISEQQELMDRDLYFYTELAKKRYLKWAKTNLSLWMNMQESLKDKDIQDMLKYAYDNDII